MHSVSNPYQCEVGGRLILGTSGQPIKDMDSLCRQNDRLRLLQSCLEWGHISPSSPDTLRKCPHAYCLYIAMGE
jgi:DNA polymerase delta subunit 2